MAKVQAKSHPTVSEYIIRFLKNKQPSLLLPAAGVGFGGLAHLVNRKYVPEDERTEDLLKSLYLGGLMGSGAEVARLGGAKLMDTWGKRVAIPDDVEGVAFNEALT